MSKYIYPSSPWLLDYILHKKVTRSTITLHILKSIQGPFRNGIKMMEVGDGEIFMKAEFTREAFQLLDSENEEYWEESLIKVEDWEMDLVLNKSKETSEYIIRIINFTVWCDERGMAAKNSMVSWCPNCIQLYAWFAQKIVLNNSESHPLILENIARLFEENRPKVPPALPDSDNTLDSISLSILLEQIQKDNSNRASSEDSVIRAVPNAGLMSSVSTENLEKKLTVKNIRDFLIHPTDAKILATIGDAFQVSETRQEKSSYAEEENAGFLLPGSSTLKHLSSKVSSQKSSIVTSDGNVSRKPNKVVCAEIDTSAQWVSKQSSMVAPMNKGTTSPRQVSQNLSKVSPCSSKSRKLQESAQQTNSEAEEEVRLFRLSRTSNEHAKCLPIKERDEKKKSDDNYKNSTKTAPDRKKSISTSNQSNASQVNKDSAETSFEIPLSGKVASNSNLNKLNSDETNCNSLDSLLDTSSENRLPRWKNLNLSSIESDGQSDSANKIQMSKKIKLSHAGESMTSDRLKGQLSSKPTMTCDKNKSISKLSKSNDSKSKTSESDNVNSSKHAANKISGVNRQKPTKNTNLLTDSHNLNIVCEDPVELYATSQELFPKHVACLSLLPSPNQLTAANNLNGIRLSQETMGTINTYWLHSRDHICQRRYWKQ